MRYVDYLALRMKVLETYRHTELWVLRSENPFNSVITGKRFNNLYDKHINQSHTGMSGSQLDTSLQWRHNGRDGVSNHQPHQCLLNRLFGRRSKKTSKLRVTGLCTRNSPGTIEFPAQMASNAENVSIWWRHHNNPGTRYILISFLCCPFNSFW